MIDLIELRQALQDFKPHQNIFRVFKTVLKLKGYWRNKTRGGEFSKGYDSRRNTIKL